ncbi:M20 metallopeptidase family protein [Paenibacillus ginsengarvi]|uniref:M20 metallopeptidase family protein n=1 Tax=Paenibacillus ginsengarvi TaxID=400777 RepID=UPI0013157863|nr:M20 family metallopeptidase [Paenibacillus ginsengarvi]
MNHVTADVVEQKLGTYLNETFRHLHRNPELSGSEFATQAFVKGELERLGIPYQVMAGTGLCAELRGGRPGKTILLRADIDALPINEATGLPYASQTDGVMHACGHDAHTTAVLGTAAMLLERREEWGGTVKLMFQPSEEKHPGGAKPMIAEGLLENPQVNAAIGIHTNPYLAPGTFGLKDGAILANADRFYIHLIGKGGHAAAPHEGADAIAMAGQLIVSLQNLVARQVSPFDNAVVTIGEIKGGYAPNTLADRVYLAGTVRTVNPDTQVLMEEKIGKTLQGIADLWGGSFTYDYVRGYPITWNDKAMTDLVRQAAGLCLGKESVIELPHGYMSADDFAYIAKAVPSVFIEWGTGDWSEEARRSAAAWHNSTFQVNPDALKYGVTVLTQTILNYLQGGE